MKVNSTKKTVLKQILCGLILTGLLLGFTGCPMDLDSGNRVGSGKYFEIAIENPDQPGRLIRVSEYAVTGLRITVTDPAGEIIQVINWSASEGSRTYQIPAEQAGEYSLQVVHLSRENGVNIQAEEEASFNIQPMVITRIDVIPGCMGFINIDAAAQNAVRIARNDLLPVLLQEAEASRYALTRLATAVNAGTVISEDLPAGQEPGQEITVEDDAHMFLLDLEPGVYFAHPVKYILVEADGSTQTYDASWWPKVDGKSKEELVNLEVSSQLIVDRNVAVTKPEMTVSDFVIDASIWGDIVKLWKEGFVVVQGVMPGQGCYTDATNTYNNGLNFFNAYKSTFSTVEGLYESAAQNVLTTIDQLANDGYDPITVYIIAHGSNDSISLGNNSFTASQFATTMSSHSGTEFNFLLGSCRGGSFVDDLAAVSNVRVVKTATSAVLNAYADRDIDGTLTDYNPLDTGSEWTSSLLYAADAIVNDTNLWDEVITRATDNSVPRTCVLLNEAGWLALGVDRSMGVAVLLNYDLTDRSGDSDPQHYCSWEIPIIIPPIIINPNIIEPIEPILP